MTQEVKLGLAQYGTDAGDAGQSRQKSIDVITEALDDGADVVVLPELAIPGYVVDTEALTSGAEAVTGPTLKKWCALAASAGAVIVAGFCEREGANLYNSAVTIGPDGVLALYRKLHLFADEKRIFLRGDRGLPVVDTPHGRIGVCVCYDLRFPEVVRVMSLRGADIIAVPTAWLPGFDATRWDDTGMCPQAHGAVLQANLDQVFIACASAVGRHSGLEFLGSSIVVDPYGHKLLGPLPGTEDCLAQVTIDLAAVTRSQHRGDGIDPRADRRTDVYQITYDSESL
mgnify:CR=1 FL=1